MRLTIATLIVLIAGATTYASKSEGDTANDMVMLANQSEVIYISDTPENSITELYSQESQPELYCMALNVYHESRSDNLAGQFAVSDVVLNRVEDPRYPNTICGVVYEGPVYESWKTRNTPDPDDAVFYPRKHRCQFSWYCDGVSDVPRQPHAWRKAQEVAYHIVNSGMFRGITEGATHYHATYVNPSWNKTMIEVGRIGEHIFYKSLPK